MKALILRNLRAYIWFFVLQVVLMLLYTALIFKTGNIGGLIGFLVVFLPSFAGIVLFLGDKNQIDHTASLPVNRSEIVSAKYLSTYIFGLGMITVTILITWITSFFFELALDELSMLLSLPGILFAIIPISLIVSVTYPLLFKFGLALGVKILFGVFALMYGIGFIVLEKVVQVRLYVQNHGIFAAAMALFRYAEDSFGKSLFYIVFCSAIVLMISASVYISIRWMRKKDI